MNDPKHVKIKATERVQVQAELRPPPWARARPKIIDHALDVAKHRIEADSRISRLAPEDQAAVFVAIAEAWLSGAGEGRFGGVTLGPEAEAAAQSLASIVLDEGLAGFSIEAAADIALRVWQIADARAMAPKPRGGLPS